jgi:D-arabinose 1-dehydrogenase-like Zn-dependent alcohol dehydrogenase
MSPSGTLPRHKIEAAVLRKRGGPLRIETLELEGPREDEILVRLAASGLCRTDIDFCDHWYEGREALVLGHEGAGVVELVGGKVKRIRAMDDVRRGDTIKAVLRIGNPSPLKGNLDKKQPDFNHCSREAANAME